MGRGAIATHSTVKALLVRQLGPRWPVALTATGAALLWPLAVFWQDISFSPDRFVEEWIKGIALGVVLYSALAILQARQQAAYEQALARQRVRSALLVPLGNLVATLRRYEASIDTDRPMQPAMAARALRMFADVQQALGTGSSPFGESALDVAAFRDAVDAWHEERCAHLLAAICPSGRFSTSPLRSELAELITSLTTLQTDLTASVR